MARRGASAGQRGGTAAVEDRPNSQIRQDSVFGRVHNLMPFFRSIAESAQVQHAVQSVEKQFVFYGDPIFAGAPAGFIEADDDFAFAHATAARMFQFECQHIRRAALAQEFCVQCRHGCVVNNRDRQTLQRRRKNPMSTAEPGNQLLLKTPAPWAADGDLQIAQADFTAGPAPASDPRFSAAAVGRLLVDG